MPADPTLLSLLGCLACSVLTTSPPSGKVVEYDLYIEAQKMPMAGKPVPALTINGGIPGPVLRFTEGDTARIRVHNRLPKETTSTHWHGLLLPNDQDGVPGVTTPAIQPGTTYTFEFPIRQSGTYWYHSHTHLQEQSGIYGSIVITPKDGEKHAASRDYVLQLSDWTNENPNEVMRSLMRGTEYYALKKGNMQSLLGAYKAGSLGTYLSNQWENMMPMDISDVAYDAFLTNGKQTTKLEGKPGERIRLRLINAAASTYFYTESATGPMTIIAADGIPVEPVKVKRLMIAIAETYDVLITLPASGQWEFRATAQDGSGHTSAMIGDGNSNTFHPAPDVPKPDLYSMDHMLDAALADDDDDMHGSDSMMERPSAPYALLKAVKPTELPKHLPRRTIPLRLTGDMERYQWSFNGKTMAEDGIISVKEGEVLRLELVNDTMMHHPLHLHGHFFRVINKHGHRSPLKHTLDIPPMGRATIEFEANDPGDWVFHCHILYHMMTGMTRVFSYENAPPKPELDAEHSTASSHHGGSSSILHGGRTVHLGEHAHEMWGYWGEASLQSHMSEGALNLRRRHDDFFFIWEAGWQDTEDDRFEYEAELIYERYINPGLRVFGGMRFTNEHDAENRGIAGVRYRLPLFTWAAAQVDSEGDFEFSLAKEIQVSDRLSLFGEVSYDTNSAWEWSTGAEYTLNKPVSLIAQFHSEYGIGGGITLRF